MSYFVVGDIHGCADQLKVLLADEGLYKDRISVFLGDYIDVGSDPATVIESVLSLRDKTAQFFALEGNHEAALKQFLAGGDFAAYARVGGTATIRAYCGEVYGDVRDALLRRVPAAHLEFLDSLRPFVETSEYLFSHAGYSPRQPLDRTRENMVLRSHQDLFTAAPTLNKLCVCGHYFQQTLQAFIGELVICLDTGCGILDGPLTAALLPEQILIQVNADLSLTTVRVGSD
jgi:serine/threonine protein phosphatase 1